jgi:CheY-like chemotaxis protein
MSRILIAEDEPRLSSFLEKGLRAAGYSTTVCDDGVKCAGMASDDEFDLLILDIGLPGQDGFRAPPAALTGREAARARPDGPRRDRRHGHRPR